MTVKVATTSTLAIPAGALAELLAACPTYRLLVGAATPAAADLHTHIPFASDRVVDDTDPQNPEIAHPRPRAIIDWATPLVLRKQGTAFGRWEGALTLCIEAAPDELYEGDPENELRDFANTVGEILDEMAERAASDKTTEEVLYTDATHSHLNVTAFSLIVPPVDVPAEEENGQRFFTCLLLIEWM